MRHQLSTVKVRQKSQAHLRQYPGGVLPRRLSWRTSPCRCRSSPSCATWARTGRTHRILSMSRRHRNLQPCPCRQPALGSNSFISQCPRTLLILHILLLYYSPASNWANNGDVMSVLSGHGRESKLSNIKILNSSFV